jgi:hypothetical protein
MNETERYLLDLMDEKGDDHINLVSTCQHCGQDIALMVDRDGIDHIKIRGNCHAKYYPQVDRIVGLCWECESKGIVVGCPCETFSRVTGYLRPVKNYNPGKKAEFKLRKMYDMDSALAHELVIPTA